MTGRVYDIAIIGGGPAGLAAAQVAGQAGARVVLVDDAETLGGHYYKALPPDFRSNGGSLHNHKQREFSAYVESVVKDGVDILSGTRVWGIFAEEGTTFNSRQPSQNEPYRLFLENQAASPPVDARCLILAPGVYDRPLPFPGWDLPGVLTPGAVQMMLEKQGLLPGKRVLVAGSGPLQMVVAAALARHGAEVVAVIDTCGPLEGFSNLPAAVGGLGSRLSEGADSLQTLLRRRVPMLFRHAVLRAVGSPEAGVQAAIIGKVDANGNLIPGTEKEFLVDTVCCAYGFIPSITMTLHLGCKHNYDHSLQAFIPSCDDHLETSQTGVYVAGDVTGVGGKPLALLQGKLAACSILERLGKISTEQAAAWYHKLMPVIQREQNFARFLWNRYRILPGLLHLADDNTLLCHCEAVSVGALRESIRSGANDMYGVKLRTRIGMGSCQGRYCLPNAALFIAAQSGKPVEQLDLPSIRPPVFPVRMKDIVASRQPVEE